MIKRDVEMRSRVGVTAELLKIETDDCISQSGQSLFGDQSRPRGWETGWKEVKQHFGLPCSSGVAATGCSISLSSEMCIVSYFIVLRVAGCWRFVCDAQIGERM